MYLQTSSIGSLMLEPLLVPKTKGAYVKFRKVSDYLIEDKLVQTKVRHAGTRPHASQPAIRFSTPAYGSIQAQTNMVKKAKEKESEEERERERERDGDTGGSCRRVVEVP